MRRDASPPAFVTFSKLFILEAARLKKVLFYGLNLIHNMLLGQEILIIGVLS